MKPFTAGCQVAISWKFSSITQSNSSSGRALFASLRAGSAWIKSPSEVSLINSILFIFPRKEPLQERAEAVPLQVALAHLFGCDVVELDGAPLAVERLVTVPAVRRDLEDQAPSGVGRYLGGITSQVVVVVEEPEAPFGRAPAGVQVQQQGDEAARVRNRFRRKAAPLVDARKTLDYLGEDLGADEVVDDEVRKGLRDKRGFAERISVQNLPRAGHGSDSISLGRLSPAP